ncbi:hypothetical protein N7448_004247 [Penicillium atrosanguineum]|uniref:Uncharacterized protein n=1 Tax=Penicillium atrosanguineum TaxID=1132637 RepID=A0A9W9PXK6_9EURO|nr:Winged helix-turn-helix transcription repressor DNA-binding [Penicillium atrosanguineum]KAJ5118106.1 hypothetical protein N7526_011129 [Penicillium atrosanguineum]KAJ5140839.1 hypothetical protein N7448_004247 [Penicillium atrosanguineum]KAJ5310751.1 Winged helix-turn-helix transcription repressor DNA-binding [Penicillium atrosanguineum]KAJ5316274.1 hypothetical protein N7476_006581 [Penicillium atrosanguineum]
MDDKVALIFGYGPHVGFAVAESFAMQGYKVAVVSRSEHSSEPAKKYLKIQADLSVPSSVESIFTRVIEELGHPTVVVYNASAVSVDPSTPLSDQISEFESANNVNIVSAYIAAKLAVKSFTLLPRQSPRTFIYTGNKLPLMIVQPLLAQGVGKAGAAHLIHYLAEEYKDQGYKFYFADERKPDGEPVYSAIDGPAHAEFYTQLVETNVQGPWFATFVKGQGYVSFPETFVHDAIDLPNPAQ